MSLNVRREILRGVEIELPPAERERIMQRVFTLENDPFRGQGRRINRFMVGADPEFVFSQDGSVVYATVAGLRPGLAFGSDQNDRLVELRPAPSRSALDVAASTLSELRWMYRMVELTRACDWISGAFQFNDGLGGHVHFGRKQVKLRDAEVRGLDGLARTMKSSGIFPEREWDRRVKGDAHGQRYGTYGDIREQKHGYEYRTLPSWLDSPQLALMVLTLSKLVIVDPEITTTWMGEQPNAWERLCGLAKYYKGRDDDAWILTNLMRNREAFVWSGGDFRPRWGLRGNPSNGGVQTIPQVIEAAQEDIDDLLALFTEGVPLPMREVAPTFRATIPSGYTWILPTINPNRRPGVGDLIPDMVTASANDEPKVYFSFDPDSTTLQIHVPDAADTTAMKLPMMQGVRSHVSTHHENQTHYYVTAGREWRKGQPLQELRKLLLSGLFPLWTVDAVQEDSLAKWKAGCTPSPTPDRFNLRTLLAA